MHKKMLLICLTFLLCGCTRVDHTDDYITLINGCLKDNAHTNDVSLGYQYYVPKGVKKVNDYNYNQTFLIDDSSIYLYVDIVSYFYKKDIEYHKNDKAIYFKEFEYKKKHGFVEISMEDDLYFVKMMYHYSKIEVYTTREHLEKIVSLSAIILNSIQYNDNLIERVLAGDFGEFSELSYEVDKPEDASNSFSQLLEESVQKEKKKE